VQVQEPARAQKKWREKQELINKTVFLCQDSFPFSKILTWLEGLGDENKRNYLII